MTLRSSIVFCSTIALISARSALGQYAFSITELPKDPLGNGMGNISGTLPSSSPLATMSNPAQLGLFSLRDNFSGMTLTQKTRWFFGEATVEARGAQAGVNLQKYFDLPLGVSLGVGYSFGKLNLGPLLVTGPSGPTPIMDPVDPFEQQTNVSLGIGMEYGASIGFGVNLKKLRSGPMVVTISTSSFAQAFYEENSAYDWGILARVPVLDLIGRLQGAPVELLPNVTPRCDISASYVHANIGDEVSYIDAAQKDPLSRTVRAGLGIELGLDRRGENSDWHIISFSLARQAEASLVQIQNGNGASWNISYNAGSGPLQYWQNVIAGKPSNKVLARKGWEISAGEFLSVRGGSVRGSGYNYETSGYSICLAGVLKTIAAVSPTLGTEPWFAFTRSHFDLQYHSASYSGESILSGISWSGVNLVLRDFW